MANPFLLEQNMAAERELQDEITGIEHELEDDIPDEGAGETRAARREARGHQRAEEKDERYDQLKGDYDQLKGRLEEMSQRLGQPNMYSQQGQPQGQPDPRANVQARIQELEDEEVAAGEHLIALERSKNASPDQISAAVKSLRGKQTALGELRGALGAMAVYQHMGPKPPTPEEQAKQRAFEADKSRFPDVFNDPRALEVFSGELMMLKNGRQNWTPSDEEKAQAAEAVRHRLKLGKYGNMEPTEQMRQANMAYPNGRSGGPGAGAQAREMTDLDWAMANATYDYEPDRRKREALYRRHVMAQEKR